MALRGNTTVWSRGEIKVWDFTGFRERVRTDVHYNIERGENETLLGGGVEVTMLDIYPRCSGESLEGLIRECGLKATTCQSE